MEASRQVSLPSLTIYMFIVFFFLDTLSYHHSLEAPSTQSKDTNFAQRYTDKPQYGLLYLTYTC